MNASGSPSARIAIVSTVHGPKPGSAASRARACVPVAAGAQVDLAGGERAGQRRSASCAGTAGTASVAGSSPASAAGSGTGGSGRPPGRRPARRARSPGGAAWVRAAAVETCWPSTARMANSAAVDGARHPPARVPWPPAAPAPGPWLSSSSTATGSASRSSSHRHRLIAIDRSRRSVSASRQAMWSGGGPQRDDAVAVRQPQRAPVRAVAPFLDAGHAGRGEVAEQVVRAQRRAERQPQRERARTRPGGCPRRRGAAARSGTARRPRARCR